jgi:pimeloyl-ACP methyl ester carboxylesterase
MQLKINGHEVYVATGNREPDPKKNTILFIHGSGQDHTIWVLPTLYFSRHDRHGGTVAAALPHAEKVVLEGSGHALLAEKPDPVLDQLIRVV